MTAVGLARKRTPGDLVDILLCLYTNASERRHILTSMY